MNSNLRGSCRKATAVSAKFQAGAVRPGVPPFTSPDNLGVAAGLRTDCARRERVGYDCAQRPSCWSYRGGGYASLPAEGGSCARRGDLTMTVPPHDMTLTDGGRGESGSGGSLDGPVGGDYCYYVREPRSATDTVDHPTHPGRPLSPWPPGQPPQPPQPQYLTPQHHSYTQYTGYITYPHSQPSGQLYQVDTYQGFDLVDSPTTVDDHRAMILRQRDLTFGHVGKPKRRRVATVAQRRAANVRERRRMFNLNEAFDDLRNKVPTFAYEKRLSRIETLRLAITYIGFMAAVVGGEDPEKVSLVGSKLDGSKETFWVRTSKGYDSDGSSSRHSPQPNSRNT